jgi:hypothetical protein
VSDISSILQTWLLPGATFALACGTVGLAWYTRKMAKSTEKALEQNARLVKETHDLVESNKVLVESEERHHQENLRPLCVFAYTGNLQNILKLDMMNGSNRVIINSDIENKGRGGWPIAKLCRGVVVWLTLSRNRPGTRHPQYP